MNYEISLTIIFNLFYFLTGNLSAKTSIARFQNRSCFFILRPVNWIWTRGGSFEWVSFDRSQIRQVSGVRLEVTFDPFVEFLANLKCISYHALRISFRSVPRLIFNAYNARLDILSIDRGEERVGLRDYRRSFSGKTKENEYYLKELWEDQPVLVVLGLWNEFSSI